MASGVLIVRRRDGMVVQGNDIGTNASEKTALGNADDGVEITTAGTIGGTASGAGNLVSGNGNNGIEITGSGVPATWSKAISWA